MYLSQDIDIFLTKDIPIVYIVCWYKTVYQVETVV